MRFAPLAAELTAPLRRLPSQCAVCRGWARQRLCDACIQRFAVPRQRCLRCACDARLLLRMKDTPHQLALPPERRAIEPRRRHEIAGRGVAVLDDVMTTGATAAEIAATPVQAGARSAQVRVLARTPLRQDA
jgi:predicted amidophosphoribosyltransferase